MTSTGRKHMAKAVDAGVPDASDEATMADAMAMEIAQPALPKFGAIFDQVITRGGCNGGPLCHGGSAGMLQMSDPASTYDALVGVRAKGMNLADAINANCADTRLVRVAPGDPEGSLLMQKIDPPGGVVPCGGAMPPTGMLNASQIEQVRTWIKNGAHND